MRLETAPGPVAGVEGRTGEDSRQRGPWTVVQTAPAQGAEIELAIAAPVLPDEATALLAAVVPVQRGPAARVAPPALGEADDLGAAAAVVDGAGKRPEWIRGT